MSAKSMDLEAQLIERAVEKRKSIIARAEEKTKGIMVSAEEEVEKIKSESEKQIISLVGSELRAVSDRIVGSAELDGRRMLMQTRQELLTKVFEDAERSLEEMAESMSAEYTETLLKLKVFRYQLWYLLRHGFGYLLHLVYHLLSFLLSKLALSYRLLQLFRKLP